jgi:hypothetical protein
MALRTMDGFTQKWITPAAFPIYSLSDSLQMVRIYTSPMKTIATLGANLWIMTRMVNLVSFRDWTLTQFISYAMGKPQLICTLNKSVPSALDYAVP